MRLPSQSSSSGGPDAELTVAVSGDMSGLQTSLDNAAKGSLKLGTTLANALDGVVTKGKSVTSIIDTLALSLSKMALNAAFKPLDGLLSGAVNGLFSSNPMPFAAGGVFPGGLPVPFASGGVIASPIAFPLGGGQTGIAGERGPEAIVPLTRGADGKLGIAGGSNGTPVHVTFNVTTPDAQSFSRSETQLAALLARTVSQGQRNL
jgi:phage-related minor tail protein